MSDKRAPVQGDYWLPRGTIGKEPGTISWEEHEAIWNVYAASYGRDQSAARIAERGGFGYGEIIKLTGHAPTTFKQNGAA